MRRRGRAEAIGRLIGACAVAVVLGLTGLVALPAMADDPAFEVIVRRTAQAREIGDGQLNPPNRPELWNRRIRITPQGHRTPIYALKLAKPRPGDTVTVGAETQVSRCKRKDYHPKRRPSGCEDTPPYKFQPWVSWRLILARESEVAGVPQTTGIPVSAPRTARCGAHRHHCPLVAVGTVQLTQGMLAGDGPLYATLVARAHHRNAFPCSPDSNPNGCQVLDLERGHGRLHMVRKLRPRVASTMWRTARNRVGFVQVATKRKQKKELSRVVQSVPVAPTANREDLLRRQLAVRARLRTKVPSRYPFRPLIAARLVLASSPDATGGRVIAERNGANCRGRCVSLKRGALPPMNRCDANKRRRFVNLVVVAARTNLTAKRFSRPGRRPRVRVVGGTLAVRSFPPEVGAKAQHPRSC